MIKRIILAATIVGASLFAVDVASAHTVLISSDPAANSVISQLPEMITLNFADPLLTLGKSAINSVEVVDPMGAIITSDHNVVQGAKLTNVLAPRMLMSGKFLVTFRVVAQDGHVVTGNFSFAVGSIASHSTPTGPTHHGVLHIYSKASGKGIIGGKGATNQSAILHLDLDFTKKRACYLITTSITDITAGHVHAYSQVNLAVSDEIFIPLNLASINARSEICEPVPVATLTTLANNLSHYTFLLHTKSFPEGAVAGQLGFVATGFTASGATLTEARKGGDTALTLLVKNISSTTLYLTGITSSLASNSMIFFDANMCQGNTTMVPLHNIAVSPGATQKLGYKFQGAMLGGLTTELALGKSVPIELRWSDSESATDSLSLQAKVVPAPQGLHFAMTGMGQ